MKRGKKMLLLLAALVLCVAGYYGAQLFNGDTEVVSEETGEFSLTAHESTELTALEWVSGEENFRFTLADGTWTNAADPAFPLDQDAVQAMADDLLAVTGARQLDGVTDLSMYGLSEPAFTVTASWSDGSTTVYAMGDETPFGDGYYLSLGHEGIVHTVETDVAAIFDTAMNDLAVLVTIPTVESATRLTVGGTLDIVQETTSRTINASETWYDSLTGAALDVDEAEDLVGDAKAIEWAALAEPSATDVELAGYGVDEASATAITLYDGDTAVLTVLIGAQDDSGDYYARLPGSTMVCTVDSSDVSALLSARAESMLSMVITDVAAENVASASFTAGAVSYMWTNTADETTESEEEAEAAGDAAADETGVALWESILALTATEHLDGTVEGAALLTVAVQTTDGQRAEMTFTEHDADSYAALVLDRAYLVDAANVDAIIRSLRAAAK